MNYKIIEVHCIYEKNKLQEVAVLWLSNEEENWVRSSFATSKPCWAYKFIEPGDELSPSLLQEIAAQGDNLPDAKKSKYFPGKRKWER